MSAGDCGAFHGRFRSWCFAAEHFSAPACREWNGRVRSADLGASLDALRGLLRAGADRTACVILEPSVQGAAGMRLQPPGFLPAVAKLCREHGVHLILDEVFVAFGRLGSMTVCGEEAVTPDLLCLAKGLTAGYLPLAATLATEEIFSAFLGSRESGRAFAHGHTFTGNPLAAAVALENLRKLRALESEGVLRKRMAAFGRELDCAFASDPRVREIRQRGFAAALDLPPQIARQVCLRARERGLLLRPLGDSLPLVPPLCLSEDEISELVRRTAAAIDDALPR
jgi:adenosylmethionine-8-amino-7-oxononanoate aminotransferase